MLTKSEIHTFIIHSAKYILSNEYRELFRIKKKTRYSHFNTNILGRLITGIDGPSFVFTYNEIFKNEIYRFLSKNKSPYIIDCGANIGLSVIYYKQLFPTAQIIAFEADKNIFRVLSNNIQSLALKDVTLYNFAVWNEETTLDFFSEGADGGRIISSDGNKKNRIKVPTIRLSNFLKEKKVDFLKIDIEGAETTVLKDCEDVLHNVENLMVEYHSFIDKPQTLHEILTILSNSGFRIHAIPVGYSSQPFVKIESYLGIDMQFNIFAYRR